CERVLEVQRDARETVRGRMYELKQFRGNLFFGGVNVLVALHDVDVDGELVGARRQGAVAFRDRRVPMGAEVPDGGRVLDQEGEVVRVEQGQHARRVGAQRIADSGVKAIVDVGEDQVQVGFGAARLL